MSDTHLSGLIISSPVEVTAADTVTEFMEQSDPVKPVEEEVKSKDTVVQDELILLSSRNVDDLGPNIPLSCSSEKEEAKEIVAIQGDSIPFCPDEEEKKSRDVVAIQGDLISFSFEEGEVKPGEIVAIQVIQCDLVSFSPEEGEIKEVEEPSNKKKPRSRGRRVHWVTDDQLPTIGRKSYELSTSKIYRRERKEQREAMRAAYNKTYGIRTSLSTESEEQNSSMGVDGATIDGVGATSLKESSVSESSTGTSTPLTRPFRIPKKKNFLAKKVKKESPDPPVSPMVVSDKSSKIKMAKKRERPIQNPGMDLDDAFHKIKMEKKSERPIDESEMEVNDTFSKNKIEKTSERPMENSDMEVNDNLSKNKMENESERPMENSDKEVNDSLSKNKMENESERPIENSDIEVNDTLSKIKMENEPERHIGNSGISDMDVNDTLSMIEMDKEPDRDIYGPNIDANDSVHRVEEHIGLDEGRNYSNYDRPVVSPIRPGRNYFLRQDTRRQEVSADRVPSLSQIKMDKEPDSHIDGPTTVVNDAFSKIGTDKEPEPNIDGPDMEANDSFNRMEERIGLDESRNYSNYGRPRVSPIRPRRNLFLRQGTRRQEDSVERIPIYRADDMRQQPLQRENRSWGRRPNNYDSYFNKSRSSARDERQDSSRNDNVGSSRSRSNSRSCSD